MVLVLTAMSGNSLRRTQEVRWNPDSEIRADETVAFDFQ